ncbi:hypothetical protein AMS68_005452 [Peltaster fructicola]|uniref:Dol-P-Man:Man(5)GlcNAc(2)-PP-Dol alpha-1,3-mannosyltransferase n=1 Tax=Peltaster fructicola TaxID=286661 RepID=A0A6H0XZ40_9PEZI|nr:hypothetical protein AMS68_005452 [Peltaster fructicola]
MSKLSEPLKKLINASQFRPNTTPAPQHIVTVYEKIAKDATSRHVGLPAWLSASTAVTMTLNSPESLLKLYGLVNSDVVDKTNNHSVFTAELMREVGLKCIGFNGVPRTINCLNAFRDGLPSTVQEALKKRKPRRNLTSQNTAEALKRGNWLWNSIYHPFTDKLTAKLASSHPDLPVHIIESEYGSLFSDPAEADKDPAKIGRVLTSVIAVACLRAQTGVGPQVLSHVFGLRKAFEDGSADEEEPVEGGRWLASDEGSTWLLESADRIVEAISGKDATNFAPGYKAKL